jgi:hypothetical protein
MPPLIESPPQEPDDLASLESRIEANSNELSYLKVSWFIIIPRASTSDVL